MYPSKMTGLSILEMNLSRITESEFREYARAGAIKNARVERALEGYILVVELTWKDGLHTLFTTRDHPRAWASLDRMVSYLDRNDLKLTAFELEWDKKGGDVRK
ncbi:hypothetical protein BGV71_24440 [Burkholderia ubonensis]|nr:hypothetical protein WI76_00425 [Burkholderia ubonensis]KVD30216.1 hypothetical protein WI84_26430 [Burkholderia ubonensis]KVD54312.1 hypothetical protein WI86_10555 [Burkholderia ubonensis]KVO30081.1 hypothetical protein WJ74_22635 [Burkholderia ubonensis]KVT55571.1 hypothetical protein WK54_17255 [Burkholderia ubonensis]